MTDQDRERHDPNKEAGLEEMGDDEQEFDGDQYDALDDAYFSAKLGHRRLRDQIYHRGTGNKVTHPKWRLVIKPGNPRLPVNMRVVPVSSCAAERMSSDYSWGVKESSSENDTDARYAITLALCLYIAHSDSEWSRRLRALMRDHYNDPQNFIQGILGLTPLSVRLACLSPFPEAARMGDLGDDLAEIFDDHDQSDETDSESGVIELRLSDYRIFFRDLILPFIKTELSRTNLYHSQLLEGLVEYISKYQLDTKKAWEYVGAYLSEETLLLPNGMACSPCFFVGYEKIKFMNHRALLRSYVGGALSELTDSGAMPTDGPIKDRALPVIRGVKRVSPQKLKDRVKDSVKRSERRLPIIRGFKR